MHFGTSTAPGRWKVLCRFPLSKHMKLDHREAKASEAGWGLIQAFSAIKLKHFLLQTKTFQAIKKEAFPSAQAKYRAAGRNGIQTKTAQRTTAIPNFYMQNGERQDESSKQNLQKRNENERKKTINKARSKQGEEQKEFKNETQEGRTRQGEHKKEQQKERPDARLKSRKERAKSNIQESYNRRGLKQKQNESQNNRSRKPRQNMY